MLCFGVCFLRGTSRSRQGPNPSDFSPTSTTLSSLAKLISWKSSYLLRGISLSLVSNCYLPLISLGDFHFLKVVFFMASFIDWFSRSMLYFFMFSFANNLRGLFNFSLLFISDYTRPSASLDRKYIFSIDSGLLIAWFRVAYSLASSSHLGMWCLNFISSIFFYGFIIN